MCLRHDDLNYHERLRFDPLFTAPCGQRDPTGTRHNRAADVGKALEAKATLQRPEKAPAIDAKGDRYHRISHEPERIRRFFVEPVLRHYNLGEPARQIIIDLHATDVVSERIVGGVRARWPRTRVIVRADSGFVARSVRRCGRRPCCSLRRSVPPESTRSGALLANREQLVTRSNRLWLSFSSVAYLWIHELRQSTLVNTELATAQVEDGRNEAGLLRHGV